MLKELPYEVLLLHDLQCVDSRDNVSGWGYEINIFSHFGPDLSSPGLTLVPTGIIKPRNLLKKLSKHERRQTNGYRMRFIVNFNQRLQCDNLE